MSAVFRRALLGPLAAVVAAPDATAEARHGGARSGNPDLAAAFAAYRAVMARKADAGASDEATTAWCEEEGAALDAITSAPAACTADLLRKVVLAVERYRGDYAGWGLWEPEGDLLSGIGEEARAMLAEVVS